MGSRIAITGSSGLIGSALVSRLDVRDNDLLLLRRPSSSNSDPKNKPICGRAKVTEVAWDPVKGLSDLSQLEGVDAVVHLAGRSIGTKRWTPEEKRLLRESRVTATTRLVEQLATLSSKPKLFLCASATGIYGDCSDKWITEASPRSRSFLGDLAHDWEQCGLQLEEQRVRVVHARFGIVLASHGGALAKMLPIFKLGLGGVLGSGGQYWSWISLNDCCRALVHLLESADCSGPYNLVSPNSVTNREFTKALGSALHRPAILPAPAFALRLAMGEMADALLLSSCRVRPARLEERGFIFEDAPLNDFLNQELKRS